MYRIEFLLKQINAIENDLKDLAEEDYWKQKL